MSLKERLVRFARKVVDGVLSQLTSQLNVVQDMAAAPMRAMVQQVIGGVWVGRGADAFVDEVSNLMLPGVGTIASQITTTHRNINHAIDCIDRADSEVNNIVNGLSDLFGNIYH